MSDIYDDAFAHVAKEFERRANPPREDRTPLEQHYIHAHFVKMLEVRYALQNGSGRTEWHPSLWNDPRQEWRRELEKCDVPFWDDRRLPEGEDCEAVLRPDERFEDWYERCSGEEWGDVPVPRALGPLTEANAADCEHWREFSARLDRERFARRATAGQPG